MSHSPRHLTLSYRPNNTECITWQNLSVIPIILIVDPARYLFVRLFSRKNGWFRVSRIGYHDELVDVQAAVDEICETRAIDAKIEDPCQTNDTSVAPEAGPSGTTGSYHPVNDSQEKIEDSGIIMIDSDLDEDEDSSKYQKLKSKKASKTSRGRLVDPLSNRSVKEVKKELQDFGLSRFAINERILAERNDLDELLGLLSLDELKVSMRVKLLWGTQGVHAKYPYSSLNHRHKQQALGKELRIPSNLTTRQTIIDAIKRTSTNQSTLTSMFAAAAAKTKIKAQALFNFTSSHAGKGKGKEREQPLTVAPTRQTEVLVYKSEQHLCVITNCYFTLRFKRH